MRNLTMVYVLVVAGVCLVGPAHAESGRLPDLRIGLNTMLRDVITPAEWAGIWDFEDETFECESSELLSEAYTTPSVPAPASISSTPASNSPCTGSADANTVSVTCTGSFELMEDCLMEFNSVFTATRNGDTFESVQTVSTATVGEGCSSRSRSAPGPRASPPGSPRPPRPASRRRWKPSTGARSSRCIGDVGRLECEGRPGCSGGPRRPRNTAPHSTISPYWQQRCPEDDEGRRRWGRARRRTRRRGCHSWLSPRWRSRAMWFTSCAAASAAGTPSWSTRVATSRSDASSRSRLPPRPWRPARAPRVARYRAAARARPGRPGRCRPC